MSSRRGKISLTEYLVQPRVDKKVFDIEVIVEADCLTCNNCNNCRNTLAQVCSWDNLPTGAAEGPN